MFRPYRHPLAAALCGIVSAALTLAILLGLVFIPGKTANAGNGSAVPEILDPVHMRLSNTLSGALDGVLSVKKSYWIAPGALSAPIPNPACFGETEDPAEVMQVIEKAADLLEGQTLFFSPDAPFLGGSKIRYYLDDTILSITWKQELDGFAFVFSETKIAHPSQFRRFLAGGEYGSDKMFRTTQMAQSVHAVAASGGDYYRFRNAGVTVYDGKVRRFQEGVADTCYVTEDGDLLVTYRDHPWTEETAQAFVDKNKIQFSLVFGPVLIDAGKQVTPKAYTLGEINQRFPRSALCQMGKLHYLNAVVNTEPYYPNTPTITEFAAALLKTGCPIAYTLDGGQTATFAVDGQLYNSVLFGEERYHSDIIYFATAIPNEEA